MAGQARDLRVTTGMRARRSSRLLPALFHLIYWRSLLLWISVRFEDHGQVTPWDVTLQTVAAAQTGDGLWLVPCR
jgi:hypothetical protein